jgi:hypothetical protein
VERIVMGLVGLSVITGGIMAFLGIPMVVLFSISEVL